MSQLMITYTLLQLAMFLLALGGFFQVSAFLRQHNSITDLSGLEAFKKLVRVNMYVALLYMVLGIPAMLLSIYLGYEYGLTGIGLVLALCVPQLLFGQYLRSLEEKARQKECLPVFQAEYKQIGETWMKKPLPNF